MKDVPYLSFIEVFIDAPSIIQNCVKITPVAILLRINSINKEKLFREEILF